MTKKKTKKKKVRRKNRRSAKFKLELSAGTSYIPYPGDKHWGGEQKGVTSVSAVARPHTVTLTFHDRHGNKELFSVELWMQDAKNIGKLLQEQAEAARLLTLTYKTQDLG